MADQNGVNQNRADQNGVNQNGVNQNEIIAVPLQVTGCTAGNFDLYSEVQTAIDCTIASEGPSNVSSLGLATLLAEIADQPPISCMINLITGQLAGCGTSIPDAKRQAAFNAFYEITGYNPLNLNNFNEDQKTLLNFNVYYIIFPVILTFWIAIWLMVGFGWIAWAAGLFLSVLTVIILYGFSIIYRIQVENFLNSTHPQLPVSAGNFEDNLAYWPQGLFAAACALTASTGTTGWTCNPPIPQEINKPINPINPIGPNGATSCKTAQAKLKELSNQSSQSNQHPPMPCQSCSKRK
jgi:hypothetical protein